MPQELKTTQNHDQKITAVKHTKDLGRSAENERAWTDSCPRLGCLSVASASKTDMHAGTRKRARCAHTKWGKDSERGAKGDGVGHERVSFNFPVTITVNRSARRSPIL